MRQKKVEVLLGLFAAVVIAAAVGCGSNSSGGGSSGSSCAGVGSSGNSSIVDVAVGDELSDSDGVNSVFLFLDILANADTAGGGDHPTADVIVNNFASAVGAAVSSPQAIFLTSDEGTNGGDMYVSSGNGEVLIWRGYAAATSGDDADVMLDNVGGTTDINHPNELIVDEDDNLVVADRNVDSIFIYSGASALTGNGGDTADVELTGNNCAGFDVCINNPRAIAISTDEGTSAGGDLYVANGDLSSNGDPIVAIYRDVNSLTTNQDPDAALTDDISFLDLSNNFGCQAQDVHVAHNVLFVALDSAQPECGQVFVFNDADDLSTDALPDAILFGNDTFIQKPFAMESVDVGGSNPTLLVGSLKEFTSSSDPGTDGPALSAFGGWFDNAGAFALVTGQSADVAVSDTSSNLTKTASLFDMGGALFAVGTVDPGDSDDVWDLYVFNNIGSGVCEAMTPNIIIPGSGLSSNAGEDYITLYGTFGNLIVNNAAIGAATRNTFSTF